MNESANPSPESNTPPAPEAQPAQAQAAGEAAAPQAAATVPAADLAAAEEKLAAARKEAADNYDRYVRLAADMENLRKRTVREKDELRQFATGRVLEDLLPVIDNLGLGLTAAKAPNADLKTLVGGITMVLEQFKSALANHGLQDISPLNQPFDPNLHESISSQASADVPEGNVVAVVRTGYRLNGRLLRPASVVVSTGAAQETVV
ncbi:nucleotide exchange factor GrpE [Nibricoccus sp. IMCC34717]|uniref:nucleotide exchange factor GrpE n=1 Tax=Nibricoccus sp. IMCC34717 TaxID=3034021 RepID=UPI00384ABAD7